VARCYWRIPLHISDLFSALGSRSCGSWKKKENNLHPREVHVQEQSLASVVVLEEKGDADSRRSEILDEVHVVYGSRGVTGKDMGCSKIVCRLLEMAARD
jgi:hypothetical protein